MKKLQTQNAAGSQFAAGRPRAERAALRGYRRELHRFCELRYANTCRALPGERVAIVRLDSKFSLRAWIASLAAAVVANLRSRLARR